MKQVIVVNEALALPRGKLAAQAAHAAIAAFLGTARRVGEAWLAEGMPKVVLACASEEELLEIHARAVAQSLRFHVSEDDKSEICRDLGLTSRPFNPVLFRARERYRDLYLEMTRRPGRGANRHAPSARRGRILEMR